MRLTPRLCACSVIFSNAVNTTKPDEPVPVRLPSAGTSSTGTSTGTMAPASIKDPSPPKDISSTDPGMVAASNTGIALTDPDMTQIAGPIAVLPPVDTSNAGTSSNAMVVSNSAGKQKQVTLAFELNIPPSGLLPAPPNAKNTVEKSDVITDEELTSQRAINDSQFTSDSAANTDSAAEAALATTGQ